MTATPLKPHAHSALQVIYKVVVKPVEGMFQVQKHTKDMSTTYSTPKNLLCNFFLVYLLWSSPPSFILSVDTYFSYKMPRDLWKKYFVCVLLIVTYQLY